MLIQFCSDLHLEFPINKIFLADNPIRPNGEILILAGDIIPFSEIHKHDDFIDFLANNFRKTYWIPGNHEYYRSDLNQRDISFHEKIRPNVSLLNNTVVQEGEVEIIFSTLWSAIEPAKATAITRTMADFHLIKQNGRKISIADYNAMHHQCLNFVLGRLSNLSQTKSVVVTHHIPTFLNYPEKYRDSEINSAFAVELKDVIEKSTVDYWIFGHHHQPVRDFTINKTTLVNNQLGYVDYNEHCAFNPARTITL